VDYFKTLVFLILSWASCDAWSVCPSSIQYFSARADALNSCETDQGYSCAGNDSGYGQHLSYCSGAGNNTRMTYQNSCPDKYYIYCSVGTTCPIGQTVDKVTGACVTSCPPAGEDRDISVKMNKGLGTGPEGVMQADIGKFHEFKPLHGGQEFYFVYPDDFAGRCWKETNEDYYCDYHAVSTGNCPTTGEQAQTPNPSKPALTSTKTAQNGVCVTGSNGVEVCVKPSSSKNCGIVNGAEVCPDASAGVDPGTGTINGQIYSQSDKNCGLVNGAPVCVNSSGTGSTTTKACLHNGGVKACVNSDVKIDSQITQTANLDGSVTTTDTKSDNIIGHNDVTKITTIGSDGAVTTTQTPGNIGVGDGVGQTSGGVSGDTRGDCEKNPDTIGCQKASGDFTPDASPGIGTVGPSSITEAPGFQTTSSCPSPQSFTVHGTSYTWSWEPVCTFASSLKPVILVMSGLTAALVVGGSI